MAPGKKPILHWKKPFTCVYGDNYDYGFNDYKDVMDWMNHKKSGNYEMPAKVPIFEERIAQHMRYKLGRSLTTSNMTDLETMDEPLSKRLEFLKMKSAEQDARSSNRLRRVKSYGAFTTKALKDIEEDIRLDAATTSDGHVDRRRTRSKLLQFDHDEHVKLLDDRRNRIAIEEEDIIGDLINKSATAAGAAATSHTTYIYENFNGALDEDLNQEKRTVKIVTNESQGHDYQFWKSKCKQMQIELEQMAARLVEAETKLKTEVQRLKKKYQVQITELEMSLDVANKNNIELQKTIKRQALQIVDLQNHYDELQRQLQTSLDQLGIAQRRIQALQGELEEMRTSIEAAVRAKRAAEQQYEEAHARVNELTTINVNISAAKSKLEGELSALQADYDEVTKELKLADERCNKVAAELKHTIDILHEEQERVVKIESIRKSLEIEVKNLQIRLEEVETNALVGGKRVISKLESRIRDIEIELEEEKRRHAETIKILRKKERHVKEILITSEEDHKNISLLTDQLEKLNEKVKVYKRQLAEQEGMSQQSLTRVRRFQRELEAAEERAESAESNLSFIRHKHRSWVTSSSSQQPTGGTKQIYVVEEHRHEPF